MNRIKKSIIGLVFAILFISYAQVVKAGSTESIDVTVTVTIGALDVSVAPASWAIGTISEAVTPNTVAIGPNYFTATNNRNADENLTLTVASSSDWTAANTPGLNQFAMKFSVDQGTNWSLIDAASGAALATDLPSGLSQPFDLQLLAPTSSTAGSVQQTIVVAITAS